jgi:hypothetical protein
MVRTIVFFGSWKSFDGIGAPENVGENSAAYGKVVDDGLVEILK